MMRKALILALSSVTSMPLLAQPGVQVAPSTMAATQTIQCPQYLEGWPHEEVDLYDCSVPGINTKTFCRKWANHQIAVPSGWDYGSVKRYSGINHIVTGNYISSVANKTYLHCAYSTNRGTPSITTYIIKRAAPSGKNCSKASNYSFRCRSRALEHMQQFQR
jgi:hypothetical protein